MEPDANEFTVHSVTVSIIKLVIVDYANDCNLYLGLYRAVFFPICIQGPFMKCNKQGKIKNSQRLKENNQLHRSKMDPGSISLVTSWNSDFAFPAFTHGCQSD